MADESHFQQNSASGHAGHEVDSVNVGRVVGVGAGLAAMVIVSMVGMVYLFRGLDAAIETELPAYATRAEDSPPPPPRVDPNQSTQLEQLRAEHHRILNSYGWVDQEAGIARVPIERAMELVIEDLPARAEDE